MKMCPCIMVVDDEQEILTLLTRILEPEGFNVVVEADSATALARLKQCSPDLVILDIMMPKLDGFRVLDYIRQYSSIPVIMLTGMVEATTLRYAVDLGADDYIRKPFHTRELVARIKAKLRRATSYSCCQGQEQRSEANKDNYE